MYIFNVKMLPIEIIYWKTSPEIACKTQAYTKTNDPCGFFRILGKQELLLPYFTKLLHGIICFQGMLFVYDRIWALCSLLSQVFSHKNLC
jgi:hypothetical protein